MQNRENAEQKEFHQEQLAKIQNKCEQTIKQ